MARPLRLTAFRIAARLKIDVDVVMGWPLKKIYEYMGYFYCETKEFQDSQKTPLQFEDIIKRMEQQGVTFKNGR